MRRLLRRRKFIKRSMVRLPKLVTLLKLVYDIGIENVSIRSKHFGNILQMAHQMPI